MEGWKNSNESQRAINYANEVDNYGSARDRSVYHFLVPMQRMHTAMIRNFSHNSPDPYFCATDWLYSHRERGFHPAVFILTTINNFCDL